MGLGCNRVEYLADSARLTKWPDLTDAQRKQYTDAVGKTVDWCRLAQAATKGRQPLMLVPHALPTLRPVVYAGLVHDVRAIFWYCWKQTSGGKVGKQKQDRNGHLLFEPPCEKLAGPGRIKRRFKPWETVVYGW